jgi:hypothetical protein
MTEFRIVILNLSGKKSYVLRLRVKTDVLWALFPLDLEGVCQRDLGRRKLRCENRQNRKRKKFVLQARPSSSITSTHS